VVIEKYLGRTKRKETPHPGRTNLGDNYRVVKLKRSAPSTSRASACHWTQKEVKKAEKWIKFGGGKIRGGERMKSLVE